MGDREILEILKTDLQISTNAIDDYLYAIIAGARGYIAKEGISLTQTIEDGMLIEMYSAWLYRKRREENAQMPRMLRWALNNRLFSEKGRPNG